MRKTLVRTIFSLLEKDPGVVLVTADLGYSVFEPLAAQKPGNIINVGIAEANMIGVSSGLALCGKRPIAYSITPFIAIRDLEQVRVDVCYHNQPVIMVGAGAGLCYGSLGPTHHGTEDIALMRAMPNIAVLAPCDPHELEALLLQAYSRAGPAYIRIGRATEPAVYTDEKKPAVQLGKGIVVKEYGQGFALIACGNMVHVGLQALEKLHQQGIDGKLVSMHTIKPLDAALVASLAATSPIATLEEHTIIGGLGSAVAESLADQGIRAPLLRIAIPDTFQKKVGTHDFLRKQNRIDPDSVASRISELIKGKK